MCLFRTTKVEQQASNRTAPPEPEEVERPEAIARLNVEVNRRAEGASELNRRLGDGAKGDWALVRCGAARNYGRSLAGKQAP